MGNYDAALSYASEDEEIVEPVYKLLKQEGLRVFYAPAKQHELVGEDQTKFLYQIYRHDTDYTVAFVSKAYISKKTPMHEAFSAMAKNTLEEVERLIPIYLDSAKLPELDEDIAYYRSRNPAEIASLVAKKLRVRKEAVAEKQKQEGVSIKKVYGDVHIGNTYHFNQGG